MTVQTQGTDASGLQSRDVVIVGAGPIGLTAALGLAEIGLRVAIVGPSFAPDPTRPDTRTTAIFNNGLQLLKNLGVWEDLEVRTQPLEAIRIIDDMGGLVRARDTVFRAEEVNTDVFGANVVNADLVSLLHERIAEHELADYIATPRVCDVSHDATGVTVTTEDGAQLRSPLVVGSDGRRSICRDAAGIGTREWSYEQCAVVCSFSHTAAHDNISTEFHRPAGPFTVVPVADRRSSLVWVERPEIAERLMEMGDGAFLEAMTERLHGLLGTPSELGPRAMFPLSGLTAKSFAAQRIVLIGESAHVMPPIGAQGLNLGYRDVGLLLDLAKAAVASEGSPGIDLGNEAVLRAYSKGRQNDIALRTAAVDVLNRTLLMDIAPVQIARQLGMRAIGAISPLKRFLISEGMAPTRGLPKSMKPGWRADVGVHAK